MMFPGPGGSGGSSPIGAGLEEFLASPSLCRHASQQGSPDSLRSIATSVRPKSPMRLIRPWSAA